MLLLACILLVGGYTLLYAGVRGLHWEQPWRLLVDSAPPIPHTPGEQLMFPGGKPGLGIS